MSLNSNLYISSFATNLLTILFTLIHLYYASDTLQVLMFVCLTVLELCFYGWCHPCLYIFKISNIDCFKISECNFSQRACKIINIDLCYVSYDHFLVKPYSRCKPWHCILIICQQFWQGWGGEGKVILDCILY